MTDDTDILRVLRDAIDIALCEEEGHEWGDVGGSDRARFVNSFRTKRCERCGKTKRVPATDGSGTAATYIPHIRLPDDTTSGDTLDLENSRPPSGTTPCPDCGRPMPMVTWTGPKPKCRWCQNGTVTHTY